MYEEYAMDLIHVDFSCHVLEMTVALLTRGPTSPGGPGSPGKPTGPLKTQTSAAEESQIDLSLLLNLCHV